MSKHLKQELVYDYEAVILKWVDGDTVDMTATRIIDFGFHIHQTTEYTGRFRLITVDTPERGETGWREATEFNRRWLPEGTAVKIHTYKNPDSFGRYLADILIPGQGQTTISELLLLNDHAEVWED